MVGKFNGICTECRRVYALDSSESTVCAECKMHLQDQANSIPNRSCKSCYRFFYSPNNIVLCPFCHAKGYKTSTKTGKVYDNDQPKRKRRGNGLSLRELNRRMEYKRVMDDEGWDHFNRGRKWDKI